MGAGSDRQHGSWIFFHCPAFHLSQFAPRLTVSTGSPAFASWPMAAKCTHPCLQNQTMFTPHSPSWSLQGRWSHNKNYTLGAHIRSKTPLHEINPKPHLKKQGLLDLVIIQVPHGHFGPHFAPGETPSHLPTGTDLSRTIVLVCILQLPLPTGSPLVSFHFLNVRKQARTIVGSPLAATSKTHSVQRYPQKLLWWWKLSLSELPNMVATSHRWQVSAWSVTSWLRKWIFYFNLNLKSPMWRVATVLD